MNTIIKTLTFAGSDASGGAGIEADLKTFTEYSTYGLAVVTTIATMDPKSNWKHSVFTMPIDVVRSQIDTALASDVQVNAMKTGMIGSVEIVELIKDTIEKYDLKNIVIDPVLACKGEDDLLNPETAEAIKKFLIPIATVTTPNLTEAGIFSGLGKLKTINDIKKAAKIIYDLGAKHVVIKGGKALENNMAIDIYYDGTDYYVLESKKISSANNHGAGCTFAAAITAGLANGLSPKDSIYKAKDFVTEAIKSGFKFNEFVGPVFHSAYRLSKKD
ncbi:bifunctional hydroxymethylpyrimidine kinase/phosphomethylpyrimidine kinase [Miniphocaeibacter massiliensis]|uniref:bifunctional hydroxymethylpyrimidine kinase/phosphomethylpyrimidine kinase n=1 Tax=Miniphocaeibacter massiliensis TaxID=2041841 RepID=UPI001F5D9FFA|nr:bifunctional hydroxymethylpyrimidine kinase/phosphomethylpyrimidine kinase [Miniphocaeibacter massiliensis]